MNKLKLLIALLFLCGTLSSQIYTPTNPTGYGSNINRINPLFALHIPEKDTVKSTTFDYPQILFRAQDTSVWFWSSIGGFRKISGTSGGSGGSGTVTSIATNAATGIIGGTIVSSGTLSIDTFIISTRAWRKKLGDSLSLLINAKQNTLTLTTTGTSGAATLTGATLNIPQYSGGGGGGSTTVSASAPLSITGTPSVNPNVVADTTTAITGLATKGRVGKMITDTIDAISSALVNADIVIGDTLIRQIDDSTIGVKSLPTGYGTKHNVSDSTITISIDTLQMSTRAWRQKGIDSIMAVKQNNINLTTTGTSGAATLVGSTINVPQYKQNFYDVLTATSFTSDLQGQIFQISNPGGEIRWLQNIFEVQGDFYAAASASGNRRSDLNVTADTIFLNPYKGNLKIDTLKNSSVGSNKVVMWDSLNGNVSSSSIAILNGSGYAKMSGTTPSYVSVIPNTDLANSAVALLSGTNSGDNAANSLYSGLVSNATHTGDATGSTALTVVRINGTSLAGLATGILKNTTGTGVPSIAVAGTDYISTETDPIVKAISGVVKSNGTTIAAATSSDLNTTFGSQTANFIYAAPSGSAGNPTFRAMTATDVPTLNQSTTGSSATLTTGRTIAITGDVTYTSPAFNGSANVTAASTVTRINGISLAGLSTGILKNTTTTGLPSIALNSDLPVMTSTVGGAVPTPPNNTTTFLRGDGTFATPSGSGTYYAPSLLTSNSTDANYTAIVNSIVHLPAATLTADRTFTMPTGANGDVITIVNDEIGFNWNVSGSIYYSDGISTVSSLFGQTTYKLQKIDGKWRITN